MQDERYWLVYRPWEFSSFVTKFSISQEVKKILSHPSFWSIMEHGYILKLSKRLRLLSASINFSLSREKWRNLFIRRFLKEFGGI